MTHAATFDTYKAHEVRNTEIDQLATKADIAHFATKVDLAELKAELLKWYIGVAMFQIAGFIAVAKILHP